MRSVRIATTMLAGCIAASAARAEALRVCADPANLPYSDRAGAGFENRIAEIVSRSMGRDLTYAFAVQRESFLRKTLDAGLCDVVIAVPVGLEGVDETRPYYTSSYVWVSRADSGIALRSLTDPELRRLRIGVQLSGGNDLPPEVALGEEGIVNNVSGYVMGSQTRRSALSILDALLAHRIDIAAIWGPTAADLARLSPAPLRVAPIMGAEKVAPLRFRFDFAMGVRKGDDTLKRALDAALVAHAGDIRSVLLRYGVAEQKGASNG